MRGQNLHTAAIYLALDPRSGMHCIVRLVPAETVEQPFGPVDPDDMNRLLMARDPGALLDAAEALGPMHRDTGAGVGLKDRCYKPSELQGTGAPKVRLQAADAERLLKECYFDPYSERDGAVDIGYHQTGRLARAAARRAVEARDFSNARDFSFADDQFRYLMEPLHDWVFARNLLSIVLRIGGLLRSHPSEAHILDKAGFTFVRPDGRYLRIRMEGDCYVAPVGFNPFYRIGNVFLNDITFDKNVIWPLYSAYTDIKKTNWTKTVIDNHLVTDGGIKFLTSVNAGQAEGTLEARDKQDLYHTWWYIALRAEDGMSQRNVADRLLRSLDSALFKPELTYSGRPMHEMEPASKPTNLLEAMWLLVRDHPDRYLLTCENCHRTVLSGTQGGERRFCSDSCRASWNKEHRETSDGPHKE